MVFEFERVRLAGAAQVRRSLLAGVTVSCFTIFSFFSKKKIFKAEFSQNEKDQHAASHSI